MVITHTTFYIKERVVGDYQVWHFGEIGVPVFFVISGVVMIWTSSNLPVNSGGAVEFVVKRLIRIVPLYWLATGVKISVALLSPSMINHNHFEWSYALKSLAFVPAFNGAGEVRPIHGVGWTLLHEVFFYALFSFSLFCRIRPFVSLGIFIPLLVAVGFWFPGSSALFQVVTSSYNLYFVLGMLVGWAISASGARRSALTFALLFFAGMQPWVMPKPLLDPVVLAVAAMILVTANIPRISWLQPAARLGDSSYALYLFHPFIAPAAVVLLSKIFPGRIEIIFGLTLLIAVGASHIIYLVIETRLTRYANVFANRLGYRKRDQ